MALHEDAGKSDVLSLNETSSISFCTEENTRLCKEKKDCQTTNYIHIDLKTDQKPTSTITEPANLRLANKKLSIKTTRSPSSKQSSSETSVKVEESKRKYVKNCKQTTDGTSKVSKKNSIFTKERTSGLKIKQSKISCPKKETYEKTQAKEEKDKQPKSSFPKQLITDQKSRNLQAGNFANPFFPITESVFVNDMVALRQTSTDLVIPGQPSFGKVVSISRDGICIVVHMYAGSICETVWPMMCRESPYTREFTRSQVIHRFHLSEDEEEEEEGNTLLQKDIEILLNI